MVVRRPDKYIKNVGMKGSDKLFQLSGESPSFKIEKASGSPKAQARSSSSVHVA